MHLGGYNGFYMMWDPTYILILVGVVLSMLASARVKSTFSWFSRVRSMSGLTGAQTAQRILDYAGIRDVRIVPISGSLTDHYDPGKNKWLFRRVCMDKIPWRPLQWRHTNVVMYYSMPIIMPPFPSGQHWSRLQILVPVLPGFLSWEGFCLVFSR